MKDIFTQGINRILLILFFVLAGFKGFAQYTKTSLEIGRTYTAMAKDQSGNLYLLRSDASNTKFELVKYTNATGVPYVIDNNIVGDTPNPPIGLAVNTVGDVFVTNLNSGQGWEVLKFTYGGGTNYTRSVAQHGAYYSALAIDLSNNLLTLEYDGTDSYQVVRYPFGAEQLSGSVVWDGLPLPSSSTTYPSGLVVDSHGNIFLTDFHENSGGRLIKLTSPGFGSTVLATNRGFTSLAVDASDNLYTIEAAGTPNVSQILKYTDPSQTGQVLYSGLSFHAFSFPWGLSVMTNGNIFANNGDVQEVVKLTPPNINVSSVVRAAANPTNAASVTYTVTFSAAATNVTTSSFTLVTTGVTGASITGVSGSGTTYTVTVNTGTGSGTIGLNVNGTGITPIVANAPFTGQVYTVDKVAPTGSILINGGATMTNNINVTLTLTGSDANPPLQMAFSLDGGGYSADEAFATTKAIALTATDGTRTVDVRLKDAAGNTTIYNASIILDRVAPNTTINSNPPNPSNSGVASFTFTADEVNCTFQASLDGLPFSAVTTPATFTGLTDGPHSFVVKATDPAGNIDLTPASYSWIIDITGPQVTGVGVPSNGYYKAGDNLDFKVRYNEAAIVDQTGGTPYINLTIGASVVQAAYIGGTGTNELTFRYTVQQGEMDMDGITVQSLLQNNSGSIKDALGNNASTTLSNIDPTNNIFVNTSIPSVTLSTVAMPTNAPFTVTATFSEVVTGLSVSDFNVLNTTVSTLATSDNITYTVLMTPASDGTRSISLPANAAVNIGNNGNTASNTLTYTYDANAPTVTSVAVPSNKYYRAGETLDFTVNFSENILLNITGGTPSLGLTIGATPVQATYTGTSGPAGLIFRYTVVNGDMDMNGIAVNTLTLNAATIRDAATNDANLTLNNVAATTGVLVNTAHPSVVITSAAPAIVNAPYTATITFSEAVSNFVIGDITASNASLSTLSTADNITHTVLVTPTADGTVTLGIAADVAENIAANGNSASNTLSRIYDIAPPAIAAVDVPVNGYYKAGSTLNFTVHFSENITLNTGGGNPQLGLTIGSSTVNAGYTGTSGTDALTFSYTVVNGDMDMDGIAVSAFQLNGSTIKDVANNNANPALNNVGNTSGVFVNTQHPTVTLSTTAPALVNAPYLLTIAFSEAVTGFTGADFTLTNATVSAPATADNISYTVTVTPTANGPVSISVPAGVAVNIGDNDNTASNTINNTYDGTVPTVALVAVPVNGYYKAGATLDFIVHFSENITLNTTGGNPTLGLTIGAATVNATYTGVTGTDALNFSYTVQSGDMDMDGIVVNSLALNGATIRDDATNNANLTLNNVGNTTLVRVNTSVPTVTLSTAAANPTNAPFNVTVTFSETVTGFSAGDFNLVNATAGIPTTTDNITYTVPVTPVADGAVSVSLPADAAVNIGDNGNTASNTLNLVYDATAPTVTSVAVPANKYYKAGETLDFTVHFSENILLNTTGGTPSMRVTIGSIPVQASYTGTSGSNALTFSYTVVNGDMDMDGIVVNALNLNGATLKDAATNNANVTLNNIAPTTGVFVNTTHPSVVITTAAPAIVNAPFTATITFSEPAFNFVIGDITTTNANLSTLSTTDNITYTVVVTPPADGTVTLNVAADVAENIGTNGNTASNTLSRIYDAASPAIAAVDVPANGYYNAGTTLNFTVHFSENITLNTGGGNPQLSLIIGASTVDAAYTGTSGTDALTFSYTVVNGDMDMDGIVVNAFQLNGSTIKDVANNNAILTLNNVGNTANVFVNTQHPTIVLSTAAPAIVNAPYTATVTFSEAVTGFAASDVTAVNATVSNLQIIDNVTYAVLVTPTADGPVSISLPADVAVNIGANGNTTSNTLSNTYDGTAPVVTSVAVPANGYYKTGTTLNFTVALGENILVNTTGGTPTLGITIGAATVNATYTGANGTSALDFSYTIQDGDMDMDGISVGPLALNGATIKDVANNNAVLTLNNVGNTSGVFVNTAHPTVTITTPAASSMNTPFTVNIAFSENVTGFTSADVAVTKGTSSPVTVIDNAHYSIIVVPNAEGVVSVNIPADVVANIGGNGNTASNTLNITYDITQPTVTSVSVPNNKYYKAGEVLNFTVNFGEDIILNTTGGNPYLTLTIGTATVNAAYTGVSTARELNFSYTVVNGDEDMDGIIVGTLVPNSATIKDAATNDAVLTLNNIGNTTGVRVNTTSPTVVLSSTANALLNAPFTVTATFSEAVNGLTAGDFTVTNGTAGNLQTTDNITHTFTVTPAADGAVTIQLPAGTAVNTGNNGNLASNTLNFTYDATAPVVSAVTVPANGYYKAGDVLNFKVSFSENISLNTTGGAPYLNVVLTSGTVQAAYTSATANSLSFSYTVQPGDMDPNGIALGAMLNLNSSTIKDDATNDAILVLNNVANTSGVFVNTQHPAVTLSTTAPTIVNAPYTVTVTFSEAVTGFTAADVNVTNATVGAPATTNNITYTVLVTPAADGAVSISVPADVAVNGATNGNTASNTLGNTYDGTAPVVTSVTVPPNGYYKTGTTLNFTVTLGENILVNTTGGTPTLGITIGTANVNAAYTGTNGTNALDFSYTVQDGDMDMDGISVGTLTLNGATIKDVADNNAVLTLNNVGNTSGVFVNTTHPTVTLTTTAAPNINAPFTVNIAFSENVTGFTSADVVVTNGTSGTVTVIDNAHYSIVVTPTAEGAVSVNVPADAGANIGGNGNTASNTVSTNYDISGPAVTSVTVPADKYYRTGEVLNFTVKFDEDIILNTTGGSPSLTLTIGTATVNAAYTGVSTARELNFSYTVVNGDEDMDGITVGALVLNGAAIKDAVTNNAVLTLNNIGNTTGVRVNTASPTVTLSSTANALLNAPFTVTATFSEAISGLTAGDFAITNGTGSNLQVINNTTYSFTVTPGADGAVSVQLPANAAVNIGNNGNTASNTLNFTYDAMAPVVSAVTAPANGYYKAGDVLNFKVSFSENIGLNTTGGAPYLNVVLSSGVVKAAYTVATANSLSFSYTVQAGDMDLDGIALGAALNLNGSTIKDDATNNAILTLNNVGNTSGVFVNTQHPAVTLSTTVAAKVNAPYTVTVAFSEAVTGFTTGDITAVNGTVSNLQPVNTTTYTVLVTPAADGTVSISIPADVAVNTGANGNTASNTLTVTYDGTAPVITAGLAFVISERSATGTLVGKVTATEAAGTLQNWTITADDSNGAFSIDANGNILVADQVKLNNKVNTTVTLTITVSDGLNTSVAVPVTIQVKAVNQTPTLDAINNVTICPDGQEHTIQLTGASAVEPGQTYGFTIITDKAANFDKLSVSAAGLITYQLKTSASGTAAVTVTIKDNGGTANGASDTLRRSFNIDVATLGTITISSDKGNSISKGDIVNLSATGGVNYRWDNADGIISGQQSAVLKVRPMQNTTYHVTASNNLGCINTADITITVVTDFKVDAVNLLTPNGDGKNDKWVIRNLDSYPNNEVKIFDRAGRLVYTRRNYSNDWDGTMNGSPLAEGTYYYILTIEGGAKTAKGYITIIRERN